MAKSQNRAVVGNGVQERAAFALDRLSKAIQKQVAKLRPAVQAVTEKFAVVQAKSADVAPKLVALFNQIKAELGEAGNGFGLADFARLWDPSVPTHGDPREENGVTVDGYKRNATWNALNYMVRSERAKANPRSKGTKRNPATMRLERVIAMVLTIAKDPTPVFDAFAKTFGLDPRGRRQLETRVKETQPLMDLSVIVKPVDLSKAPVVPMAGSTERDTESGEVPTPAEIARGKGNAAQLRAIRANMKAKGRTVRLAKAS